MTAAEPPTDADERRQMADWLWPLAPDAQLEPISDQLRRRAALALREIAVVGGCVPHGSTRCLMRDR